MPTCWYLFRHRDVVHALQDDRLGRERVGSHRGADVLLPAAATVIRRVARGMVLFADPPRHDRLRRGLERAWSPGLLQRLDARAAVLARELLAGLPRGKPVDLIAEFCLPLPVMVMADALGVPASDRRRIKRWSGDIVALTDLRRDDAGHARAARATAEVVEYLRDVLARRRRNPREDLLSGMAALGEDDDGLTEDEILANAVLLLAAGHETTLGLLGNGLLALLENPGLLNTLRGEPSLAAKAVEEVLRMDSPIQMTFRLAHEDLEIGGKLVRRGEAVALVLGAANRDPSVFPNPDRCDLERPAGGHVAFGGGRHTCYGAGLARREARIAFLAALPYLEGVVLTPDGAERSDNFLFRSLKSLWVAERR